MYYNSTETQGIIEELVKVRGEKLEDVLRDCGMDSVTFQNYILTNDIMGLKIKKLFADRLGVSVQFLSEPYNTNNNTNYADEKLYQYNLLCRNDDAIKAIERSKSLNNSTEDNIKRGRRKRKISYDVLDNYTGVTTDVFSK